MSGRRIKGQRRTDRAAVTQRGRPWRVIASACGVLGALIAVVITLTLRGGGSASPARSVAFVGNAGCPTSGAQQYGLPAVNNEPPVGQPVAEMPHLHVNPPTRITYLHDPPTSGCHYNIPGEAPIKPGVYDRPVDPEYWVHNLEHGYVVVLYNCPTGCTDDFQKLRSWYAQQPPDPALPSEKKLLVLPWTTMRPHFAVLSWDWYQAMDSLDLDLLQRFYANHVDQSPESNQAA